MKHKITIYNEERVTMEGVQVTMKVKVDQFDVLGDWSGGETYEEIGRASCRERV